MARGKTIMDLAMQQFHDGLSALSEPEAKEPPIKPHPGPQADFVYSDATITVYGGQAGSGKSFALHLRNARYAHVPGFTSVLFRRKTNDLKMPGGLWSRAHEIYPLQGGTAREDRSEYRFPSGATVRHSHMEHENHRFDWSGSEICHVGFDEIQTFTASQFWFMTSRNRSTCGVQPFISATCNPDPDSFIFNLIGWWIDPDTGLAIPERSGKIRWLLRADDDKFFWGDTPEEATEAAAKLVRGARKVTPMSFTFIHASLEDNPTLTKNDPHYIVKLQNLPLIERERLLGGNWHIRPSAGKVFNRDWFAQRVPSAPPGVGPDVRGWDKAASAEGGDRTASVRLRKGADGKMYVLHAFAFRASYHTRDEIIRSTAEQDGAGTQIELEQEPGSGGKESLESTVAKLVGYVVKWSYPTGAKLTRWQPAAVQAEAGNLILVDDGSWNVDDFVNELHNSDGTNNVFDDYTDALAAAIRGLGKSMSRSIW